MTEAYDQTQIGRALAELNAQADQPWEVREGKLRKEFRFVDFAAAFGFMASVAIHAEQRDHHPEWSNVYNRVDISLTTHDAGGISELDFELAHVIEELARR